MSSQIGPRVISHLTLQPPATTPFVIIEEGRVIDASVRAIQQLGYRSISELRETLATTIFPDTHEAGQSHFDEVVGDSAPVETTIRTRKGDFLPAQVMCSRNQVGSRHLTTYIWSAPDVAFPWRHLLQRKQTVEMRVKLNGDFITDSHDFPLISGTYSGAQRELLSKRAQQDIYALLEQRSVERLRDILVSPHSQTKVCELVFAVNPYHFYPFSCSIRVNHEENTAYICGVREDVDLMTKSHVERAVWEDVRHQLGSLLSMLNAESWQPNEFLTDSSDPQVLREALVSMSERNQLIKRVAAELNRFLGEYGVPDEEIVDESGPYRMRAHMEGYIQLLQETLNARNLTIKLLIDESIPDTFDTAANLLDRMLLRALTCLIYHATDCSIQVTVQPYVTRSELLYFTFSVSNSHQVSKGFHRIFEHLKSFSTQLGGFYEVSVKETNIVEHRVYIPQNACDPHDLSVTREIHDEHVQRLGPSGPVSPAMTIGQTIPMVQGLPPLPGSPDPVEAPAQSPTIQRRQATALTLQIQPSIYSSSGAGKPAQTSPSKRKLNPIPRVLHVDDDEKFVIALASKMFAKMIEAGKVTEYESALSVTEAVEKVSLAIANGTPFDLVLMDYHMPEINGDEGTRMLLKIDPALKIAGATSNADTETAQLFTEAGAESFISKPLNPAKIKKLMETYQASIRS